MLERLQKRIAGTGITSRRTAEKWILDGIVKVNGTVVTELGTKVSDKDTITIGGKPLNDKPIPLYLVMNKPRGVLCTVSDPKNRKTVIDLLPEEFKDKGLYPVGRLDYDTKGLILLTNDGDFMNTLVGPKSGIQKEYLARIEGILTDNQISMLTNGIMIDRTLSLPSILNVVKIDSKNNSSLVDITITQGLYHQVKKMFSAVGHDVKHLTRIRFGNLTLEGLSEGEVRNLTPHEIKELYQLSKQEKTLKPTLSKKTEEEIW